METARTYTDPELIQGLAGGSEESFTAIHKVYYRRLVYFAFQLTKQMPQAEDIASVCLMKVWEKRGDFATLAAVRSFLA